MLAPVDIAVTKRDELVHLLVALGADVNRGISHSLSSGSSAPMHLTILDSIQFGLRKISERMSEVKRQKTENTSTIRDSSWKAYHDDSLENFKALEVKASANYSQRRDESELLRNLESVKSYFMEAQALLISHQTKSWTEDHPDEILDLDRNPYGLAAQGSNSGYMLLSSSGYSHQNVPKHIAPLYDELFEAAFMGDNDKIQNLCLSTDGSQRTPIQIACKSVDKNDSWASDGGSAPGKLEVR